MIAVIGAGVTGLSAAVRITERLGPGSCVLLEAGPRAGGKIRTHRADGMLSEDGPDAVLARKPQFGRLCADLGLAGRLIAVQPEARGAFVRRGRRLYPLPAGLTGLVPARLWPMATSNLLSLRGRLRAGLEVFMPRRRDTGEESVADFIRRRFGPEVWDRVAEPLLAGINAGAGDRLSLPATFPHLADTEGRHRSILLAGWRAAPPVSPAASAAPTGFVTLAGGLGELVDTLVARLAPDTLRLNAPVRAVRRGEGGWMIDLDGETLACESVLVTVPAAAASPLLRPVDAALGDALAAIPFSSSAVVTLAWPRSRLTRTVRGSGWVVPRIERSPVIAVSLTSSKFPHRAPDDRLLIRVFLGRRPGATDGTDADLMRAAREEVAPILGVTGEPVLARVARWPDGLPQYTIGHRDRVRTIQARLRAIPGLDVAGCSYHGVGIPDCIGDAWAAVDRLLGAPVAA